MVRMNKSQLPKDSWMKDLPGTLPRGKKGKKLKPVGIPEDEIQSKVEDYLNLKGIKYLHVPDAIYRLCSPYANIPISTKVAISDSLKGVPDLLIFKPVVYMVGDESIPSNDNSCLMMELKKKNGKARQSQKKWHKGVNVVVVDNIEDGIKIINEWGEIEND